MAVYQVLKLPDETLRTAALQLPRSMTASCGFWIIYGTPFMPNRVWACRTADQDSASSIDTENSIELINPEIISVKVKRPAPKAASAYPVL